MPITEINAAIYKLETDLKHLENFLDHSIANNEVLAKTKVILHQLKQVSKELSELKKIKTDNN
jgi:hypothetical protein